MAAALTRVELEQLAGRRIYERGERYAAERRVHSLRVSGATAQGQVVGSEIYETWLHLDGSFGYGCSCPYEGLCKHVVALAITWWEQEGAQESGPSPPSRGGRAEGSPLGAHLAALTAPELSQLVQELAAAIPGAWQTVVEFILRRRVAGLGREPELAEQDARQVRDALRGVIAGELRPPAVEASAGPDAEVYWDYADAEMPDSEPYRAVERLAATMLEMLADRGAPALRVQLLLLAKRCRDARGELEHMEAIEPQLYDTVAVGLSHDDLDSAIVLWSRAVEKLIGQKQRSAYAEAARMLLQMRRAMVRGGREVWWWKYYGDLQMRYSGYKVLREELESAGLNRQDAR